MARTYVPKKSARWRDRDKRMARAVELRAGGLSLRAIAEQLVIDEGTVRNDLKRWAELNANVTPLRNSAAESRPRGGAFPHPDSAPVAAVVPIRRSS
jgi:hypothetical protein